MRKQTFAYENKCDNCGDVIPKGAEYHYTRDEGAMCEACAEYNDMVCKCGETKKSEYRQCYECAKG